MGFELPEIEYDYDALEPHLDSQTMELHHSKHHAGYTANLNAAVQGTEHEGKSIEEIMIEGMDNPAIRNNGGGYWNHSLFWKIMSPSGGGEPRGNLANAINDQFGSFSEMKDQVKNAAMTRFGSGWAWLCVSGAELTVCSTPNQDNPLMTGEGVPILGIDVWEHAYYKKFGPGRGDYIDSWWNVVDWDVVSGLYENTL
ncbi:MAG: superoxide dismutase [Euryarchaeota archaeon]|nr:superoxide dismutase [Euryarchaeota archaeon]|tara:strand:- start:1836 stop:2429 length:594 start_codon:yes stop_codon:yes gene_type:complete